MNAESPIDVTLFGITVFLHPTINSLVEVSIIAFELSLESYTLLFMSTLILVNEEQPLNAQGSIDVTLLGIVILVKELQ